MELTYDIIRPGFYADGRVYNSKLLYILKNQYAVFEKKLPIIWFGLGKYFLFPLVELSNKSC